MDISEIGRGVTQQPSRATQALNKLGDDYTTFLTLLTAQISNQDPLEPIDSTTFVTQLAQLTQVEQAAQSNIQLETLGAKLDAMALVSSASLIGQTVRFPTDSLVLGETGAEVYYQVEADASSVVADIYSPAGILVRTITGLPSQSGQDLQLSWNGKSETGQDALRGNYLVKLRAEDALGNPLETALYRDSPIREVSLLSGEISYLVDGGQYITPESVLSVKR